LTKVILEAARGSLVVSIYERGGCTFEAAHSDRVCLSYDVGILSLIPSPPPGLLTWFVLSCSSATWTVTQHRVRVQFCSSDQITNLCSSVQVYPRHRHFASLPSTFLLQNETLKMG